MERSTIAPASHSRLKSIGPPLLLMIVAYVNETISTRCDTLERSADARPADRADHHPLPVSKRRRPPRAATPTGDQDDGSTVPLTAANYIVSQPAGQVEKGMNTPSPRGLGPAPAGPGEATRLHPTRRWPGPRRKPRSTGVRSLSPGRMFTDSNGVTLNCKAKNDNGES